MAIKLILPAFNLPIGALITDLGYDVEDRLISAGVASRDLSGAVAVNRPTIPKGTPDVQAQQIILRELDRTDYYDNNLSFAVDFAEKDVTYPVPLGDFDLSGVLNLTVAQRGRSCTLTVSLAHDGTNVVIGDYRGAHANCLPALTDGGSALYFIYQRQPGDAYKMTFHKDTDGARIDVTQLHGDAGHSAVFTIIRGG